MNEEQKKGVLKRAIETYGKPSQVRMAIEEMSELTKALCKFERADSIDEWNKAFGNVIEEIADVQIMLDQLRIIFGNDAKAVEDVKLNRLADRIYQKEILKRGTLKERIEKIFGSKEEQEERANE